VVEATIVLIYAAVSIHALKVSVVPETDVPNSSCSWLAGSGKSGNWFIQIEID